MEVSNRAEGHHLYDKSHNYHSSIINDEKNPYLLITREELISKYHLKHHPIFPVHYAEIYRSTEYATIKESKENKQLSRPCCVTVRALICGNEVCYLHRVPFDVNLHFYLGKPVVVVILKEETKSYAEVILGNNLEKNEDLSVCIPANTWFGGYLITNTEHLSKSDREEKRHAEQTSNILIRKKAEGEEEIVVGESDQPKISGNIELVDPESFNYGLIGITMTPGFEQLEEDVEVGKRDYLVQDFPSAMDRIQLLTKNTNDLSQLSR